MDYNQKIGTIEKLHVRWLKFWYNFWRYASNFHFCGITRLITVRSMASPSPYQTMSFRFGLLPEKLTLLMILVSRRDRSMSSSTTNHLLEPVPFGRVIRLRSTSLLRWTFLVFQFWLRSVAHRISIFAKHWGLSIVPVARSWCPSDIFNKYFWELYDVWRIKVRLSYYMFSHSGRWIDVSPSGQYR